MMVLHILLTILKWIGILLLAVIGLALLFVAAILFVPVRYQAKGSKHEQMQVSVCVSWLFHLLHISLRYEDGRSAVQLRVCGIPLRRGKKKKKKAKKDTPDTGGAQATQDALHTGAHENADTESAQDVQGETQDTQEDAHTVPPENAGAKDAQDVPEPHMLAASENTEDTQEKKGFFRHIADCFRRIRGVLRAIRDVLRAIRDAFLAAKDRVVYVCGLIRRMWSWWQQWDTNRAVAHIKGELRYLLQMLKPRKYDISLRLGTGDPASTGEMLGALGLVYAWTNGCFTVTPDFEEQRFEADFWLKGRIFIYQLLGIAIRLWQDEDVRTSLEAFRNR